MTICDPNKQIKNIPTSGQMSAVDVSYSVNCEFLTMCGAFPINIKTDEVKNNERSST